MIEDRDSRSSLRRMRVVKFSFVVGVGLVLSGASCATAPPQAALGSDASRSPHYIDPKAWLCLPGRDDACAHDITATDLHPDGSRTIERRPLANEPKVDCFYVYPTVDADLNPGNHTSFDDVSPMTAAALAQAARFRETCALYVPLYRQATIGSYLHPDVLEAKLGLAFSDVEAAFRAYVADHDRGRPIVLIGHSQGAEMVVRLLQRFFDRDPVMRARLLLAMAIGGDVEVPKGKTTGGTFANVPICTKTDETGCVVAYQSQEAGTTVSAGRFAPREGNESVCVNPAGFGGDEAQPLSRAYLLLSDRTRRWIHAGEGVETPFLELEDFYVGKCEEGNGGYRYLAISVTRSAGDTRRNPVDFAGVPLRKQLGLHLLDLQLTQGDLVDLVARRAGALP